MSGMTLKDMECTRTGVFIGLMNDDFKQAVLERPKQVNGYCNTGTQKSPLFYHSHHPFL